MTKTTILLQIPLPAVNANGGIEPLPTEFRIFAAGDNPTSKGTFVFDEESAASVMAAFADHGMDRLPLDFDHGMMADTATAETSKAAGWFVPQIRDGVGGPELWAASIEWTPSTAKMLTDREYRFISPAFTVEGDRVTELLNVALTNLPATKNLQPLVANTISGQLQTAPPGINTAEERQQMKTLLSKLAATDEAEAIAALSQIETAKKQAEDRIVELAARIAQLEADRESSTRETMIAKLSESGQAPPAMHGLLRELSIDQLEQFGTVAPKATTPEREAAPSNVIELTDAQRKRCSQLGISTAEFVNTLKIEQDGGDPSMPAEA